MNKYMLLFLCVLISSFGFSQELVSENFALKNGNIDIPGTLTHQKTNDKIPLVIFVHGSGNVDRNGNQPGTSVQANYIKSLADSLNLQGIAFYRYDKRTATPSNLQKLKGITLSDFVDDVKVAIRVFESDDRFNGIHLIGHSQGSLVAMLAATESVKSYTSIAGPSTSIDQTIIKQLAAQNEDMGKMAASYFEELKKTDTILVVNPFLMSLFAPQNQKFMANWMSFNPSEEIQKLKIPVLILQGDADLQVKVVDAENLKKAKPGASLHIIPKMNHVLKRVASLEENNKSYADKNFPISNGLVTYLTDFIFSNIR